MTMPTTILYGETIEQARARRFAEEAAIDVQIASAAMWNKTASSACAVLALATQKNNVRLDDGELFLLAKIVAQQTELRLQTYRLEDNSGLCLRAISNANELPGDIEAAMMEADEIDIESNRVERAELATKRGVYWAGGAR
jgi:hypothetical protein